MVLLEASTLAAASDQRRAATVLARRLLAYTDAANIAVAARPRNPRVADMYRVLGFAPLPAGDGRTLLRPARQPAAR